MSIKNGKSRDTGNIGYKTQNETNKIKKKPIQKYKKMSNPRPPKKPRRITQVFARDKPFSKQNREPFNQYLIVALR
jgi:hypothetical protein